jgi:hypothetical protein
MADLIQEFFKRDLRESELDALEELLGKKPEEALRFEGLLENYYLVRVGLPKPQFPRSLQRVPGIKGLSKAWWTGLGGWLGFGALAFAGTLAATVYHHYASAPSLALSPSPTATPMASLMPTSTPITHRSLALPVLGSVQPNRVQPGAKGDDLSVVVTAPKESLVTVRMLDAAGQELRVLFSGFVQPGNWAFKWDGMLLDGKMAPPGDYEIHVQSGGFQQSKKIKIRPNGTSNLP